MMLLNQVLSFQFWLLWTGFQFWGEYVSNMYPAPASNFTLPHPILSYATQPNPTLIHPTLPNPS